MLRIMRGSYLLATMVALAALNPLSQRIALAQIPEAPGSFSDSDGGALSDDADKLGNDQYKRPPKKWAKPKSNEPTPDPARDTIDEMNRARERASGSPEPEPTPKWN
jgi:hypothetical protein